MQRLTLLALLLFIQIGCAHIEITHIEVLEMRDNVLLLKVETDEALHEYDDSNFAHRVYMRYSVFEGNEEKLIKDHSGSRPFSARRIPDYPKTSLYSSIWKIPLRGTFEGLTHDLADGQNYILIFSITGGRMIGAYIKSNAYRLAYPN